MSDQKIVLVALSDEQCNLGNINLRVLMNRSLRTEKRMVTRVMIEDEQRRYNTYCDRIEFYCRQVLLEGKAVSCDLGTEYLDLVARIKDNFPEEVTNMRLTANYCPREFVADYLTSFENLMKKAGELERADVQNKLEFYRTALAAQSNVFELMQSWIPDNEKPKTETDPVKLKEAFLALAVSDNITEDRGGGHFVALKQQIERVVDLTNKGILAAINFSDLRHDVIAEIVHDFVYMRGRPIYVAVTYSDGSEASPFPLFCLKTRQSQSLVGLHKLPILNVGMMAGRHQDGLDDQTQVYWYRNQEISIGRSQAETDDVAYRKSKELLVKMRSEGPYRIHFYQTGFQPAIVGFYRALTEELIFREKEPASLEVTPYYFMGGKYDVGKVWN